ncbi:MAG: hypothetical protein B6I20_06415 [Bacteroidetes bacterium 4572_117]|nr:MAG: hypothetical protein B6I20_06415 [Bacteroidetes bacterium 4572_117]
MLSNIQIHLNSMLNFKYRVLVFKLLLASMILLVTTQQNILSQRNIEDFFYSADDYVDNENFTGAISLYQRMLIDEPNSPEINFKLGFCYLNTAGQKGKAIKYLEKSLEISEKKNRHKKKNKNIKDADLIQVKFYLAKAYQSVYQIDEALQRYMALRSEVKGRKLSSKIDIEIEKCRVSKKYVDNPMKISINNLGYSINSEFSDHSPVISADESVMIFTSRRKNSHSQKVEPDGEYNEDIYISYFQDSSWTKPIDIGSTINTVNHEASIGLSVDGQKLFIYKSEDEGSIYLSTLDGDVWTTPKKLGEPINTKNRETHASLSADGNRLYFTSDRKGGYGGLDIYVSYKKISGKWSEPKNLGPTINSSFDERAPYIHADGKTLYYSTKAYDGLGGFDIFKSKLNEFNTWTKPENLGYPINTVADDVFYMPTADGQRAYYVSKKADSYGKSDIYIIALNDAEKTKITVMTGKVHICRGDLPEVSITVMNAKTNEVVGIYTPNSKSGMFLFVLSKGGKYNVIFEAEGEIILSEELIIEENAPYQQLYKVVEIPADPPCVDEQITVMAVEEVTNEPNIDEIDNIDENGVIYDQNIKIENILFPFNSSKITKSNSLDSLSRYLNDNTGAIVEVGAYADATGNAAYNYKLSVKRGKSVKSYLINKGVKAGQVIVQGYGEENPITLNFNSKKEKITESMKFNRRIEFRVIKQGKYTLLIKPLSNIPDKYKNEGYDKYYKKAKSNYIETKI